VSQPNSQQQADATRRLQLTNLQAAAQGIGVDPGSPGWTILEWLIDGGSCEAEWKEVWTAVNDGKVSVVHYSRGGAYEV
jgi:hypothetical protein